MYCRLNQVKLKHWRYIFHFVHYYANLCQNAKVINLINFLHHPKHFCAAFPFPDGANALGERLEDTP